jgi:uncharacterized protein YbaR (Trm112 family)
MAITEELLAVLACPVCRAATKLESDQKSLKCIRCHRVYPIRDEVPVMLADEAGFEG